MHIILSFLLRLHNVAARRLRVRLFTGSLILWKTRDSGISILFFISLLVRSGIKSSRDFVFPAKSSANSVHKLWHDSQTFTVIKLNRILKSRYFGFKSSRLRPKRTVGQTANETVLRRTLIPQKYLPATSIPELLNIKVEAARRCIAREM